MRAGLKKKNERNSKWNMNVLIVYLIEFFLLAFCAFLIKQPVSAISILQYGFRRFKETLPLYADNNLNLKTIKKNEFPLLELEIEV